jgi:CheY-like chemotaxis protein
MPKTLLLADDSVTIQKVVGISFANEDVRIVTVDNGDDAIIRAREVKPDIVLADVVMPGKSGYDVCAAIKGDPELRGVPVLLLTGTFETFDEDRAARVGADGHITKPFEAQALVELVNARLAAASSTRSAKPGAAAIQPRAQAEPEPFDFLEPEEATLPRRGQSAPPVASSPDEDAFAFEVEPLDSVELETEDESDLELGNEVTEARTALLIDSEVDDAATAQPPAAAPVGFSARDFDGDEVTRLVLPESGPADAAPSPGSVPAGDPLEGIFQQVARDPFSVPGSDWDVASSEVDDPYQTRVLTEPTPAEAEAPQGFAEPLFDDEPSPADEFELPSATPAPAPQPQATPASGAAPLSPQLRDQVHETLEKIAWEALGDLSERIVREAVQRIEQVAWDVVPRLAETLVREEIRKLKGEE